ncbi:MAG: flagellar motor switch phosphatase FliY [Peptostreptococcaceae bacterium]|nr:flagellar motor switch phosphatase FliY [Peptostreptococcaceae bacterium]
MSDNFLSREEIDSLHRKSMDVDDTEDISPQERDVMGEVGNLSMSTVTTALSTLLNKQVSITTTQVELTTFKELVANFETPYVLLQVKFNEGLHGTNALLMRNRDASIIANLMMGGDGSNPNKEMSEIEFSAVSEAMNQMIGSTSTAISTMLGRSVDIDTPFIQVGDDTGKIELQDLSADTKVVKIVFNMKIEDLIDSEITQLYMIETAKEISKGMLEGLDSPDSKPENTFGEELETKPFFESEVFEMERPNEDVRIQKPMFAELKEQSRQRGPRNIDLIFDVPLELSVVLGKTKKSIKDILALEPGTIVELNKLVEEPLEIYINGKHLAQGEVVVVDEKFGIRITNILSAAERVLKLG